MKVNNIFLALTLLLPMVSCKNEEAGKQDETMVASDSQPLIDVVTAEILEPKVFDMEIVSNGKIGAKDILGLAFEQSGIISRVCVDNGTHVSKGDIIAVLDTTEVVRQIDRKKMDIIESEISLKDILIGLGYTYENIDQVPESFREIAMIKSGYLRARKDMEDYEIKIEKSTLRAPFAGVVANLNAKVGGMTGNTVICDLIGDAEMDVEFTVLQNELGIIKIGDRVTVKTFDSNDKEITGRIKTINPVVNDNGHILVKASLQPSPALITGMNVRVYIRKSVPDQLVLPKSAVTERSGRKVVFSVKDGRAYWNYVNLGFQNSRQYTITDGLEAGMEIITSGAQNLSDGCSVRVQD